MGIAVETGCASIAASVGIPQADGNLIDGVIDVGSWAGLEPVLGAGVVITKNDGWQTRYGVVVVSGPVLITGLSGDELCESKVTHTGRADSVHITGIPIFL